MLVISSIDDVFSDAYKNVFNSHSIKVNGCLSFSLSKTTGQIIKFILNIMYTYGCYDMYMSGCSNCYVDNLGFQPLLSAVFIVNCQHSRCASECVQEHTLTMQLL